MTQTKAASIQGLQKLDKDVTEKLENLMKNISEAPVQMNDFRCKLNSYKNTILCKATTYYDEDSWETLEQGMNKTAELLRLENIDLKSTLSRQGYYLMHSNPGEPGVQTSSDFLVLTNKFEKVIPRLQNLKAETDELIAENTKMQEDLELMPKRQPVQSPDEQIKELRKQIKMHKDTIQKGEADIAAMKRELYINSSKERQEVDLYVTEVESLESRLKMIEHRIDIMVKGSQVKRTVYQSSIPPRLRKPHEVSPRKNVQQQQQNTIEPKPSIVGTQINVQKPAAWGRNATKKPAPRPRVLFTKPKKNLPGAQEKETNSSINTTGELTNLDSPVEELATSQEIQQEETATLNSEDVENEENDISEPEKQTPMKDNQAPQLMQEDFQYEKPTIVPELPVTTLPIIPITEVDRSKDYSYETDSVEDTIPLRASGAKVVQSTPELNDPRYMPRPPARMDHETRPDSKKRNTASILSTNEDDENKSEDDGEYMRAVPIEEEDQDDKDDPSSELQKYQDLTSALVHNQFPTPPVSSPKTEESQPNEEESPINPVTDDNDQVSQLTESIEHPVQSTEEKHESEDQIIQLNEEELPEENQTDQNKQEENETNEESQADIAEKEESQEDNNEEEEAQEVNEEKDEIIEEEESHGEKLEETNEEVNETGETPKEKDEGNEVEDDNVADMVPHPVTNVTKQMIDALILPIEENSGNNETKPIEQEQKQQQDEEIVDQVEESNQEQADEDEDGPELQKHAFSLETKEIISQKETEEEEEEYEEDQDETERKNDAQKDLEMAISCNKEIIAHEKDTTEKDIVDYNINDDDEETTDIHDPKKEVPITNEESKDSEEYEEEEEKVEEILTVMKARSLIGSDPPQEETEEKAVNQISGITQEEKEEHGETTFNQEEKVEQEIIQRSIDTIPQEEPKQNDEEEPANKEPSSHEEENIEQKAGHEEEETNDHEEETNEESNEQEKENNEEGEAAEEQNIKEEETNNNNHEEAIEGHEETNEQEEEEESEKNQKQQEALEEQNAYEEIREKQNQQDETKIISSEEIACQSNAEQSEEVEQNEAKASITPPKQPTANKSPRKKIKAVAFASDNTTLGIPLGPMDKRAISPMTEDRSENHQTELTNGFVMEYFNIASRAPKHQK